MTLGDFLGRLSHEGVAMVMPEPELSGPGKWEEIVRDWDRRQRLELAVSAPDLSLPAAQWAAMRLYRGCQAVVCRDVPPEELHAWLAEPCPVARSAETDYSVDLLFRFLPDLVALARRLSQNDPLVRELLALAQAWPLSSVGIETVGAIQLGEFFAHPGLRQLYVDRIVATEDLTRLQDEAVRQAVKTALGAYPEMAPRIAAALKSTQ